MIQTADLSPFDAMSSTYDKDFSSSVLGSHMRRAVQRRLDVHFRPGDRILELGCGTGEDAVYLAAKGVHVVALDPSAGMVEQTRRKARLQDLTDRIDVFRLAIEDLDRLPDRASTEGLFDGAVSNFGPLNCVEDLQATAHRLAERLRPGGRAVLVPMGPWVPWEWLWYLLRGRPEKAVRRLRPGGVPWRGLTIRYPSVSKALRSFEPRFQVLGVRAVGALLPPTYAEAWACRHRRLIAALDRWERRWEHLRPLARLADHYVLELERRP